MSQSNRHIGKTHIFTNRASSNDPNIYIKPGANEVLNIDLNGGSLINNAMDDNVVEFLSITGTGNALIVSNGLTASSATITNVSATNISSTTLNVSTGSIGSLTNSILIGNTITAVNSTITNLQVSNINGASYPPAVAAYVDLTNFGSGIDGDLTLSASSSNYLIETKNYRNVYIPTTSILYLANTRLKCSGTLENHGLITSSLSLVPSVSAYVSTTSQPTTSTLVMLGTQARSEFQLDSRTFTTSIPYPYFPVFSRNISNPSFAGTIANSMVSQAMGQGGYYTDLNTAASLVVSTANPKKGIYEFYHHEGSLMTAGNIGNSGAAGSYALTGTCAQWPTVSSKFNLNDNVQINSTLDFNADGSLMALAITDNAGVVLVRSGSGYYYDVGNTLSFTGRTGSAAAGASIRLSDGLFPMTTDSAYTVTPACSAVAAGYTDNSNVGALWAYVRRSDGLYVGTKISRPANYSGGSTSYFGNAVNVSGDGNYIVGCARGDSTNVGAAWVFVRSGTGWSTGSKLIPSGGLTPILGDLEHQSAFSYDGSYLALGGGNDNTAAGAVWVFVRSGSYPSDSYSQLQPKLTGQGRSGTQFGTALDMDRDGRTLVSTTVTPASGIAEAWVFIRSGTTFTTTPKLTATGTAGWGYVPKISGDGTVIACLHGAPATQDAWVFVRNKNDGLGYSRFNNTSTKLLASGYSGSLLYSNIALSTDATCIGFNIGADRHVGFAGTGSAFVFNSQIPGTLGGYGGCAGGVACVQANTITGSGLITSNGGRGGSVSCHFTTTNSTTGLPGGGGSGGYTIVEYAKAGHTFTSFGGSAGSLLITTTASTTTAVNPTSGSNGEILISDRTANSFTYITSGTYTV